MLVTYRQSPRDCVTIRSLERQRLGSAAPLALLVHDNSPEPVRAEAMPDPRHWSVTYRHDPSNSGVSAAYRAGAELARKLGKKWLLFLDQDTRFASDAMDRYSEAVTSHSGAVLHCPILKAGATIISPCLYRRKRGKPLHDIAAGLRRFTGVSVLNSGMCVAIDAYDRSGGHDPAVPLDFSDHDFIARFQHVVPEFVVVDTVAEHGFSGTSPQSAEAAQRRFELYCAGALRSSRTTTERVESLALVSARALLLAYRYRHAAFMWTALSVMTRDDAG